MMSKVHRQQDLSKLIEPEDIQPLLDKFTQNKYVISVERLMEIARDNAYSNHWKDLIYRHIQSKDSTTQDFYSDLPPMSAEASRDEMSHTENEKATKPSSKKTRRRKS